MDTQDSSSPNTNDDVSVETSNTEPVETTATEPATTTTPGADAVSAETVLELESMIKQGMTTMDRNKAELKKLKEMLESALLNDEGYRIAAEKAKEAAKEKGKAKLNVTSVQANKVLEDKIKDMVTENKELATAQSEYLREYARLSGTTEIEGEDGEVREIIYVAKLIKKARRGR